MAKILLIEPDHKLATIYKASLEAVNHDVVIATNAQSAINQCDNYGPDIVIIELQLVDHSGIEFLYELRSYPEWQAIPAIILSHIPMAEFAGSYKLLTDELGVISYHYKPKTSLKSLQASIDQACKVTM